MVSYKQLYLNLKEEVEENKRKNNEFGKKRWFLLTVSQNFFRIPAS